MVIKLINSKPCKKNSVEETQYSNNSEEGNNGKIIKKGVVKDYSMKQNQLINLNPFDIKANKPLKKEIFKYLTTPYFNFDCQNNQKIIKENKSLLDQITNLLLEKETINKEEIDKLTIA